MALINISITNPRHVRVMNAICALHGYEAVDEEGIPNPETKALFAERKIREVVLSMVTNYEQRAARDAFIKQNPVADLTID